MANRIILVSDDSDFFDFIRLKLELRKSDELFTFSFDDIPDKVDLLQTSVIIVNSENSQQKTLDLLKLFNNSTPIIVTSYNDDEAFRKKCYRAGMIDFIPLLTSDAEFRAKMLPALSFASILEKNNQYRQLLVKNKIIDANNEVFINYEAIIDNALTEIKNNGLRAVFAAIAPDNRSKFFLKPNQIETIILNNIRKNDILMNYSPNKYYLLLFNTDIVSAQKHWHKISKKFPYEIYAGFVTVTNQNRQQLINGALNNLHEALNSPISKKSNKNRTINITEQENTESFNNFKMYRKNLSQRLEMLVTPALYSMQQKCINKLSGVKITQSYKNGIGIFNISNNYFNADFKITSPGLAKINIDIILRNNDETITSKRFTFDPDEIDTGLLEDLLSQFITESKHYCG